ncbi:hypothetical protein D3C83_173510 [compost metagenome]
MLFERHFEKGAARQLVEPLGRPDLADHRSGLHGFCLAISTLSCRAFSRASGVTTTSLPTTILEWERASSTIFVSPSTPDSK